MSMYSELLVVSMASGGLADGDSMSKDELLAAFLARRREAAITGAWEPDGADMTDQLVRHIDYDVALLRLCASLGIRADPAKFGRPQPERMRLERELVRAGIHLDALDPDDSAPRS